MKKKILLLLLTPLITILFCNQIVHAQLWTGEQNPYYWKMWSINIHGGVSSYYGDLSVYDKDYYEKINFESGPSAGMLVTKYFNRAFSASGQVLFGNLQGTKNEISFHADIFEYNLQIRMDVINLVNPAFNNKFGLVAFAGLGQFLFYSTKIKSIEGVISEEKHSTRVPEFVYFAGGEFYYNFNNKFGITVDLSIHQCQNDKLDIVVKNLDYDYYSVFSAGITYYLTDFMKIPPRNKARIAHSSVRL